MFPEHAAADPPSIRRPAAADAVTLRQLMRGEVFCARPDLDVHSLVHLMIEHRIGCIPVVDERRRPIGVITKFDLVEQLDAAMQAKTAADGLPPDLLARTAEEVMMPIALTLPEQATIAHAAAMIAAEDTHHVLVVDSEGTLRGVISTRDIVVWMVGNDASCAGLRQGRHGGKR